MVIIWEHQRLEQHVNVNTYIFSEKLPVPTDLRGSTQALWIQVRKDAEAQLSCQQTTEVNVFEWHTINKPRLYEVELILIAHL